MTKTDKVLVRIDADIARLRDIETFVKEHDEDSEALLSVINIQLVKLQEMRAYVTQDGEANAPKVKRTRKAKAKPGLPSDGDI